MATYAYTALYYDVKQTFSITTYMALYYDLTLLSIRPVCRTTFLSGALVLFVCSTLDQLTRRCVSTNSTVR
jgi:hypothetical protein